MKDSNLNFRISSERKEAFNQRVEELGKRTGDVLNELIDKFLADTDEVVDVYQLLHRIEKLEEKVSGELAA